MAIFQNIRKKLKVYNTNIPRLFSRNASLYEVRRTSREQEIQRQQAVRIWVTVGIALVTIISMTSFILAFCLPYTLEIKKIGHHTTKYPNQIGSFNQ